MYLAKASSAAFVEVGSEEFVDIFMYLKITCIYY